MPDYPPGALAAAEAAIIEAAGTGFGSPERASERLARAALDAAAPALAEAVAQKILAHMEAHGSGAAGLSRDRWRRHMGIAARVAAGAFSTDEDMKRMAVEALERGDWIRCDIPEVPGA
jgi:hypothetical protein